MAGSNAVCIVQSSCTCGGPDSKIVHSARVEDAQRIEDALEGAMQALQRRRQRVEYRIGTRLAAKVRDVPAEARDPLAQASEIDRRYDRRGSQPAQRAAPLDQLLRGV